MQSYVAVFKQAADPIYYASGVSSSTYGATLTDVGKDLYKTSDLTSDGSNSYLKTDNTEYRLQFYAQDNNNTYMNIKKTYSQKTLLGISTFHVTLITPI